MAAMLTPEHKSFFEKANIGFLATAMPDGSPHVTAVWVDVEDDLILVNTAVGRVKERNVRDDPRVALAVIDRENPYSQVMVRGEVVAVSEEDASAHIDELARKYLGEASYPWMQPGERRIKLSIRPDIVIGG